jgi:hypothetical protein
MAMQVQEQAIHFGTYAVCKVKGQAAL